VEALNVGISVAVVFVESNRGDFVGDCVHDVLMERGKHEADPHLSLGLGGFLFCHFRERLVVVGNGR